MFFSDIFSDSEPKVFFKYIAIGEICFDIWFRPVSELPPAGTEVELWIIHNEDYPFFMWANSAVNLSAKMVCRKREHLSSV